MILKTDNSDKLSRFQAIAEKYDVVVYRGDNEGDMPFGTYGKGRQERNAIADVHKAEFGVKYIVLPNPIYGDWKGALAKIYYKLIPEQKTKVHREEYQAAPGTDHSHQNVCVFAHRARCRPKGLPCGGALAVEGASGDFAANSYNLLTLSCHENKKVSKNKKLRILLYNFMISYDIIYVRYCVRVY